MSLQFSPEPYLAAFKAQQERTPTGSQIAGQIGEGLNNLGDTALGLSQEARQQKLQALMAGYKAQEQNDDPYAAMSFMGYGQRSQPPSSATSLSTEQGNALMPSMRPGQGLQASAGVSDAPRMPQPSGSPTPITQSPVIAAWNKSKGVQTPQAPGLFTRKPFDVNGVLTQLKNGDASAIANLNDKQMKQLEATPAYIQMKKKEGAMPVDEAAALLNLDDNHAQKLKKVYGNGLIPQDKWQMLSSGIRAAATIGTKESNQQDKLEQQAKQSITSLRGDKSLARTEEQRDAAVVAYNRIQEIEKQGGQLNPIDYTDILGQIYKARTGAAPTEQVLNEIRQATAKGQFGKAYTYITGQQAPATTQDITKSLKDMASSMGQQADKFHESYMKTHLIKPQGLENSRWQPIYSTGRGQSFQEATGYQPTSAVPQFDSEKEKRYQEWKAKHMGQP